MIRLLQPGAGAVGLGLAVDFIEAIGREAIRDHEHALTGYAVDRLARIDGVRVVPGGQRRLSVMSFNLDGVHPHDVGTILDQEGIAIRTGHHCAQPVMDRFGVPATARASLAFYNTHAEIDALAEALHQVKEVFR